MVTRTYQVLATQLVAVTFDASEISDQTMIIIADELGRQQFTDEDVAQFLAARFVVGDLEPGPALAISPGPIQTELVGD